MTIQEPEVDDPRPVTHTHLTKAELMNAIGYAACHKNGLIGEYNMQVTFQWSESGELLGAKIEQRKAAPGSTGQPPLYRFLGIETLAEAAAGPEGELITGARR